MSWMLTGAPPFELLSTNDPLSDPPADGTKVTFTVQLCDAASVSLQVSLLSPKPLAFPVASTAKVSPVSEAIVPWLLTVTSTG
jgi:hypothetical protein